MQLIPTTMQFTASVNCSTTFRTIARSGFEPHLNLASEQGLKITVKLFCHAAQIYFRENFHRETLSALTSFGSQHFA